MKNLPKVNIAWVIAPTVLFLLMTFLSYGYYSRTSTYIDKQNTALDNYVKALDEANFNTTYNANYVLEQLKLIVNVADPAQQKLGFDNIINFKAKQAVTPPDVPIKQF
jgi:heme/copper-type cytochrome/quinol oxidase subunit 2